MYRLFSLLLTVAQRKLECLFMMPLSGWENIFLSTAGAYPSGSSECNKKNFNKLTKNPLAYLDERTITKKV